MNDLGPLEVDALRSAFMRRVADDCPSAMAVAVSLWDRIGPPNWTLEWQLARWLGDSLGMDPAVSAELVLSNVVGLGSLRLQDDLLDHEITETDRVQAAKLSQVLYTAAIDVYRRLIPARSPFWSQLELRMAEWRSAAGSDAGGVLAGPAVEAPLALRGAPLKLCAFAVCELAGRMDKLPAIESCLDEALTAMVLYDHAVDWEADLEAGRWNAFVAAFAPASPSPDRARVDVYVAMMAGSAVSEYFAQIRAAYERAVDIAGTLAVADLTDYLRSKMAEVAGQAALLEHRYGELGNRAAKLMFAGSQAG